MTDRFDIPLMNLDEDRLAHMMRVQQQFQEDIANGYALSEQDNETRIDNIRISILSCLDELHEALNEVGWKPWASSKHINREAFAHELIDAWHFFMNLMLHVGMTPTEMYDGYLEKQVINRARQRDGYDGVTTKCPACKRAYDDKNVKCHKGEVTIIVSSWPGTPISKHNTDRYCEVYGYVNADGTQIPFEDAITE